MQEQEPKVDENIIGETLTPKQEAFCQFYTQVSETFGNGTLSYASAYDYDLDSLSNEREIVEEDEEGEPIKFGPSERSVAEQVCASSASRMLRNVKIDKRIRTLLNEMLTNEVVDARLIEIIMSGKPSDSVQAIREFNKLKQRIVEKKDITSNGQTIGGFNFVRAEEPVPSTPKLPEPNIVHDDDNSDNQADS
jgi:hypothetical protein